jgi:plastocyanin
MMQSDVATESRGYRGGDGLGHVCARAVAAALLVAACSSAPTAPTASATITIGPDGIAPSEVRIKAWSRVAFTNHDTRSHTIVSDPVDEHTQCPPINAVGIIPEGQTRETGTLNLTATCGFHDHDNKTNRAFQGRIIIE